MFTPLLKITHGPLTAQIYTETPLWVGEVYDATLRATRAEDGPGGGDDNLTPALVRITCAGCVHLSSSNPDHAEHLVWPKLNPRDDAATIAAVLDERAKTLGLLPVPFYGALASAILKRMSLSKDEEGNSAGVSGDSTAHATPPPSSKRLTA